MASKEHLRTKAHLGAIASLSLKREHIDDALDAYANHLRSLPEEHIPADDQAAAQHAHGFFQGMAEEAPEMAREQPSESSASVEKRTGYRWRS
jgi:hypothetical protein